MIKKTTKDGLTKEQIKKVADWEKEGEISISESKMPRDTAAEILKILEASTKFKNEHRARTQARLSGQRLPLRSEDRPEIASIRLTLPIKLLTKFDQYCENEDYTRVEGIREAMRVVIRDYEFEKKPLHMMGKEGVDYV